MTEAQVKTRATALVKEIDKQKIEHWFLDDSIDNQLRHLLVELLASDLNKKIRFLLRRGMEPQEILEAAKDSKRIVVEFHKKCPPGYIIKGIKWDHETARHKATARKK